MRPEDVLPDQVNTVALGDLTVRKGSVAAFLGNALLLTDPASSAEARREAEQHLRELVPALRSLRLFEVFAVRDEAVRRIVEETP